MPRRRAAWTGLALCLLVPAAAASDPDPELDYAARTLAQAGVGTDGPGLLAFFRSQTFDEGRRSRLADAARRLGDDSFAAREEASRELAEAGRAALPYLRPALDSPDPEVARRARLCLEHVPAAAPAPVLAAARLLADRRPAGAAEVLLTYLPGADDDEAEEAVFAALEAVGLRDGKVESAVAAALADPQPVVRAAAAHAAGRAPSADDRRPVARLLADADARVRFEAAAALAYSGEREAVPALVALLGEGPLSLACRAEELLGRLAGAEAPEAGLGAGNADERRRCREAWAAWWEARGARADLARLRSEDPPLGLTLVCEFDGPNRGRVAELGKDGKARWEVTSLEGPNDAQLLPGGRVLVAERNGNRVTERDRRGRVVWECPAPRQAIACQRLPGGTTLVATFTELFEVTRDGKRVFEYRHPGGFRHAVKTRDGHTHFVTSTGLVGELGADGRLRRTVRPAKYAEGAAHWASVEPRPGGRYLLALGGANKVVEIDPAGRILWEASVASAVFATRLPDGHTLVSSFQGRALVELDRAGHEVHRQALQGRPFTVRRY
jgi:HEAT repeat protein